MKATISLEALKPAITQAMADAHGHIPIAAKALGVSRRTLARWIATMPDVPRAPRGYHIAKPITLGEFVSRYDLIKISVCNIFGNVGNHLHRICVNCPECCECYCDLTDHETLERLLPSDWQDLRGTVNESNGAVFFEVDTSGDLRDELNNTISSISVWSLP